MDVKPILYKITSEEDNLAFVKIKQEKNPQIFDEIEGQILELVLCQNPKLEKAEIIKQGLVEKKITEANCTIEEYGTWVYYPWKNSLVHTLDEEEFIEVRTNRNKYKITQEEQDILRKKKVGIVGLSVGRSIATTLAIERVCGEIRLADFDELELSNLNRINAPLTALGKNKAESTAHEILELDPYIKIRIFKDGLTEANMDSFFQDGGKIDILVEECDGLEIKILSRLKARALKIPVVMEASDNAILDIERFDLEPNRKLLHGLLNESDIIKVSQLKTNEEKIPFMMQLMGVDILSTRIKASMLEVEQSLVTWPQLASDVFFGGSLVTNTVKSIFLNNKVPSSRRRMGLEHVVSKNLLDSDENSSHSSTNSEHLKTKTPSFTNDLLESIIKDACRAPSIANSQPWNWVAKGETLFLELHNKRSYGYWDPVYLGAKISCGAALFNLKLSANKQGLETNIKYKKDDNILAEINFSPIEKTRTRAV